MGAYFDSPDRPNENACSGCGKFVANPAGGYQRKRTMQPPKASSVPRQFDGSCNVDCSENENRRSAWLSTEGSKQ